MGVSAARHGYWSLPALTTLLVCLHRIGEPALWRDEMSTWWAATRSTDDFLELMRHVDTVHATYYLMMRGWVAVAGDSVVMLRLPSTLALAAAAALIAVLGRRLYDATTGLIAGMLLAALPGISWYGQEARTYAFVVLAVVAATLLLVRALDEPTWARFGWYAVAVAAVGLFHLLALAVLVGHLVAVVASAPKLRWAALRWVPAVTVGVLPVVPVFMIGRDQQAAQLGWLPAPSMELLLAAPGEIFRSASVAWIVLVLAVLAVRLDRRSAVLVGWAVAGPLVLFGASQAFMPLFHHRYILYVVPAWCLLAAAAAASLLASLFATLKLSAATGRWIAVGYGTALIALVVSLSLPVHDEIREVTAKQGNDYASALAPIRAEFRPGDGIAYAPGETWMMLKQASAYYLPRDKRPAEVFANGSAEQAGWWVPDGCTDFRDCATDAPRIWIVRVDEHGGADPFAGLNPPAEAVLRDEYTVQRVYSSPGLMVALLTRESTTRP